MLCCAVLCYAVLVVRWLLLVVVSLSCMEWVVVLCWGDGIWQDIETHKQNAAAAGLRLIAAVAVQYTTVLYCTVLY